MNRKEFRKQSEARFDAFEKELDARFDKFNANFDKLDASLDKLDANFDKLESSLDKLESSLDKLDDIDKMIKEQIKTYEQINDSLSIIQRDCQNNEDSY